MKQKFYKSIQGLSVLNHFSKMMSIYQKGAFTLLALLILTLQPQEVFSWRQVDSAYTLAMIDEVTTTTSTDELTTKGMDKMSSSTKFKYDDFANDWRGLVGFSRIRSPKKRTIFGMRPLKGNETQIKKYVQKYFPGYEYISHESRNGKCKWIVILDKEKKESINAKYDASPFSAMRLLEQLDDEYLPTKERVYLQLLGLINNRRDNKRAINYAPSDATMFWASIQYLRHAKNILELAKMAKKLPKKLDNSNDPVCVVGLEFLNENNLDSIISILRCDPQVVLDPIIDGLPCKELVPYSNRIIPKYQELFLEKAECRIAKCIDCKEDYDYFINIYHEDAACIGTAFPTFVSVLSSKPDLWEFIDKKQVLATRYRDDINETLQTSISKRDHLVIYHTVFDETTHLEWGAEWALKKLPLTDIGYLIDNNTYINIETFLRNRIYLQTTNKPDWAYFYLKKFRKKTKERKEVYLNAFALEDNTLVRYAYILDYLIDYGVKGINEIEEYWDDCGLKFYVANAKENLAKELHQECLECTNDKASFIKYANIPVFNPHMDGIGRIEHLLKSEDLRDFYEDYPGLRERIGDLFVDKAVSVEDIEWFLTKYSDHPDAKRASLKGIELQAKIHGKGAALTTRVARHLLKKEFGFDPAIVMEYISCEQMLPFLNLVKTANAEWQKEIFPIAVTCINSDNLELYKPFFPEEPEFQQKVIESIAFEIQDTQQDDISVSKLDWNTTQEDSISLTGMNHPCIVLNTEKREKGLKFLLITPNRNEKEIFINDDKVYFLPEEIGHCKIKVINEKEKGWFNKNPKSKSFTLSVYDFPSAIQAQLKNVLKSQMLRERFFKSCKRILDNKATWDDYELVLGSRLAKFAGKNKTVDKDLRALALETAQLYFTIAKPYYPSKRWDRIVKKLGQALEKKTTSIIGD